MTDAAQDALFEAGCDDATFATSNDVQVAGFDREAVDFAEAVASAIKAVESAVPGARRRGASRARRRRRRLKCCSRSRSTTPRIQCYSADERANASAGQRIGSHPADGPDDVAKVGVAGSNPVVRSNRCLLRGRESVRSGSLGLRVDHTWTTRALGEALSRPTNRAVNGSGYAVCASIPTTSTSGVDAHPRASLNLSSSRSSRSSSCPSYRWPYRSLVTPPTRRSRDHQQAQLERFPAAADQGDCTISEWGTRHHRCTNQGRPRRTASQGQVDRRCTVTASWRGSNAAAAATGPRDASSRSSTARTRRWSVDSTPTRLASASSRRSTSGC